MSNDVYFGELDLRTTKPGYFKLLSPMEVRYGTFHFTVPKGFDTNLASIPPGLRSIFNRLEHRKEAVAHDYLYDITCTINLKRKRCDQLFYEFLVARGMNKFKAWCYYIGVRVGGGREYKKHKK